MRSRETACAGCQEAGLLADLQPDNVGTRNEFDREDQIFDTPTLRELWRTASRLHDGSAATLHDVRTIRNPGAEHGWTSHPYPRELDNLVEYLLCL